MPCVLGLRCSRVVSQVLDVSVTGVYAVRLLCNCIVILIVCAILLEGGCKVCCFSFSQVVQMLGSRAGLELFLDMRLQF